MVNAFGSSHWKGGAVFFSLIVPLPADFLRREKKNTLLPSRDSIHNASPCPPSRANYEVNHDIGKAHEAVGIIGVWICTMTARFHHASRGAAKQTSPSPAAQRPLPMFCLTIPYQVAPSPWIRFPVCG